MGHKKQLVLDASQVEKKITRICYEIYEANLEEELVILYGITKKGYLLAQRLAKGIESLSPLKVVCLKATLIKKDAFVPSVELEHFDLNKKSVLIVDDVLNTGYTLAYVFKEVLNHPVKKISTVVLVDRKHRRFPVRADIVGLTLSTTLESHIEVSISKTGEIEAFLL